MTSHDVAILAFMFAAVFVLLAGGVAIALMLYVWMRAFVKFANVHLVFRQADAFGRAVAPVPVQPAGRGRLPTRPAMAETDDADLEAAVRYHDDDGQGEDDDDDAETTDDGRVRTMDENAGFDSEVPPVGGGATVGGRAT